jgi:dUTP pyrophosphatase
MITNPEDIKKIQDLLEQLQKNLGIDEIDDSNNEDDFDFSYLEKQYGLDMTELENNLMATPKASLEVYVQKIHEDAVLPSYNYTTDSGFDFYSVEEITIGPLGRALVPTGLKFDLPPNVELQVRSKSGLAIKDGLMVLNSPGTVDNGYTGEVQVIIFNTNQEEYIIKKGMKIAQGVLTHVLNGGVVELFETNKIKDKDRNANGFGSTGR